MKMEEFLQTNEPVREEEHLEDDQPEEDAELDIQKAVVESLAADKAEQEMEIVRLREKLASAEEEKAKAAEEKAKAAEELGKKDELIEKLKKTIAELNGKISDLLSRQIDMQARNPNALALLDRDVDVPDRFPGESRDHVLEVVKEAKEAAEREGRLRRAQVLEGVLVANEPNGNLAKRREALKKLFIDNANIINGPVIEELEKLGISYKNGDDYLLTGEILLRNY